MYRALTFFILCILTGCSWQPRNASYQQFYAYYPDRPKGEMCETDYFLVVLAEARHLDYGDNACMLKTMAKHPSDGSKNGDVGHVWVYVEGWKDGERVYIEGGQSGDTGCQRPTYMWGIIEGALRGDPNPARYLWESFSDGFFQPGSGQHTPTYAAKIDLTQEQFDRIVAFICDYDYKEYSIRGKQCCSFAVQAASLFVFTIKFEALIAQFAGRALLTAFSAQTFVAGDRIFPKVVQNAQTVG